MESLIVTPVSKEIKYVLPFIEMKLSKTFLSLKIH